MFIKRQIPNLLTIGNLLCGTIAIMFVLSGDIKTAAVLIVIAAILDFFDGFVARLLNVQGPLGKELDSLADVVSFGVVPAYIVYQMQMGIVSEWSEGILKQYLPYTGLLLAAFAAYRLAKFNIDERQSYGFLGLPTPAMALFFISLGTVESLTNGELPQFMSLIVTSPWVMLALTSLFSLLMISELPLIAMKFKGFQIKGNEFRYTLIIGFILLPLILGWVALPFFIIWYLLISLVANIISKGSN